MIDTNFKLPQILNELAILKEKRAALAYTNAIVGNKSGRLQLIELHINNLHEKLQWVERTVTKTLESFADNGW